MCSSLFSQDEFVQSISAIKKRMSRRRSSMERSSPKLTSEQIKQFHTLSVPASVAARSIASNGSSTSSDNAVAVGGENDASLYDGAPRRFGFLSKLNAFGEWERLQLAPVPNTHYWVVFYIIIFQN